MKNHNQDRRNFMKTSTVAALAFFLAPYLKKNVGLALADAKLAPLLPTDPMATALGYHTDAKKVDKAKWVKKAGADGASQRCENCALFTAIDKTTGKCQIFAGKSVATAGWCNSWVKKA